MNRKVVLYNSDNTVVMTFANKGDAQRYCESNNICNKDWVSRSLESGEKFYDPSTRKSSSRKGYEGYGMYVKWAEI